MKSTVYSILLAVVATWFAPHRVAAEDDLVGRLKLMGHRNWIVIADMAYPQQSNPAIETIYIGGSQVALVQRVLKLVEAAPHVRPVIYTDAELPAVSDADAPGIEAFRRQLKQMLGKRSVEAVPHEQTIGRLDEAAKLFHVLVLKTDMTLPYTSVFIELQCGYWTDAAEARLRKALDER